MTTTVRYTLIRRPYYVRISNVGLFGSASGYGVALRRDELLNALLAGRELRQGFTLPKSKSAARPPYVWQVNLAGKLV
jgi:hypothetical protein